MENIMAFSSPIEKVVDCKDLLILSIITLESNHRINLEYLGDEVFTQGNGNNQVLRDGFRVRVTFKHGLAKDQYISRESQLKPLTATKIAEVYEDTLKSVSSKN